MFFPRNFRAHCLTRISSSNVNALCKPSAAVDLPLKKFSFWKEEDEMLC